jgi:hypothetical protein
MIEPTLPPKLPSPKNSFFHQAATASAFAPVIGLGVTFISVGARSGLNSQSEQTVAFTVGIAVSIIMLMGFICGIIALFGIRKHGTKGILGKSLCGIIVPLLLTGLAVPNFMAARSRAIQNKQNQAPVEDQLRSAADQLNKQSGKMIDEVTRLEGVEALPNRTLLYKYSLITKTASEIPADALKRNIRPNLVKVYNTHPDMKKFRDNGVTMVYRYSDKGGELIGEISVGSGDIVK